MINKVLIFGGIALSAILIIENYILSNSTGIVFVYWVNGSVLVIVSLIIGIFMGFGVSRYLSEDSVEEDKYDF